MRKSGETHRVEIHLAVPCFRRSRLFARARAELSERAGPDHRSIPGRWRDRRARPRAQRPPAEPLGSAGRLRISPRRRRPDRHAAGGDFAGGRLHPADGVDRRHPGARRRPCRQRGIRHCARACADLADRGAALYRGGPSVAAGEDDGRADRPCQAEPGQAHVRLVRRRLGLASVRRAVPADGGHRPVAHFVSRHRAGRHRSARRAHRHDVLAGAGGHAAYRGRDAARDRHDRLDALGAVSGFPDRGRDRASRLFVARLVRIVRAGKHSERDRGEGQRRHQDRAVAARRQAAAGRAGRRARAEHARGLCRVSSIPTSPSGSISHRRPASS